MIETTPKIVRPYVPRSCLRRWWMYFRLGRQLSRLFQEQAEWSQQTFGSDLSRGPSGPLKHLASEVLEALRSPEDIIEYADCQLLALDAVRRGGFGLEQLLEACWLKFKINRNKRSWPQTTSPHEPVFHRQEDPLEDVTNWDDPQVREQLRGAIGRLRQSVKEAPFYWNRLDEFDPIDDAQLVGRACEHLLSKGSSENPLI